MKNFLRLTFLLFCVSSFACKKAIEAKQRDMLMDAMTNGEWKVHQYVEASVDITNQFYGYTFKFEKQGTVQARYVGSPLSDGTWIGDVDNYTVTSNFPTATDPVTKLNGVWKLTDGYLDYVEAEMITPSGKNILHLIKIP